MIIPDAIRRSIKIGRSSAKFVAYDHSSAFIDASAELGRGFYYVDLYDEQIDANLVHVGDDIVMVHNTYLTSFAYNLFLCWLYAHLPAPPERSATLDGLLAHNFKKFFAEQLLRRRSDVASRGLLLETLLFEQAAMVPVFAAKAADTALADAANLAADIMSSVLSFHELGHYFLDTRPGAWDEFLAGSSDFVRQHFAEASRRFPDSFIEELKCDTMSVHSCLIQYENRTTCDRILRILVFAFSAYAVMFSLSRSAEQYRMNMQNVPPEIIDLKSLEKHHRDHVIPLGIDQDFVERARFVAGLCQHHAAARGISLYGADGDFPLPDSIADDLMRHQSHVLECADPNARAMSSLVAESLAGHADGMEYLYLRSKTFVSNRAGPLRV